MFTFGNGEMMADPGQALFFEGDSYAHTTIGKISVIKGQPLKKDVTRTVGANIALS